MFMTILGSAYASMHTDGHNLERVIGEARMLERRHIKQGAIADPYLGSSSGYGVPQGFQQPTFQIGSTRTQAEGTFQ